MFRATTSTAKTTAPLGSVTVPESVASVLCENTEEIVSRQTDVLISMDLPNDWRDDTRFFCGALGLSSYICINLSIRSSAASKPVPYAAASHSKPRQSRQCPV